MQPVAARTNINNRTKINYIDHLRVFLTTLVILHHTSICYGAPGGWYYTDKTTNAGALIAMTLFVATNQAFFMGFFFFLSALFTERSYIKKGSFTFTKDRLKRLGLPLLFYSFILSPILNFLVYRFGHYKTASFIQYLSGYDDWIDPGVLWFVAALLLFTLLYVAVQQLSPAKSHTAYVLPPNYIILLFALSLGILSYLVRIIFPVGWVLHPLGFQFAHFTQYIALFILGIVASRKQWLEQITYTKGKQFLVIALILVFVVFPFIYGIKVITNSPLETFQGGGTWQSLIVAVWEQVTGISIITALLGITKQKWNNSTRLLRYLARAAFATYIIHPLAVISITLLLTSWQIDPAIKFLVAAPIAVLASFLLASLIVKLPLVKDVV